MTEMAGATMCLPGSEDDVWSLYQNNPDLIQACGSGHDIRVLGRETARFKAPLIQIGAGNTAQAGTQGVMPEFALQLRLLEGSLATWSLCTV